MFVTVKERTSVIGLKKAIGAKSSSILFEFLLEAIILCFTYHRLIRRWCHSWMDEPARGSWFVIGPWRAVILCASAVSLVCFFIGVVLSYVGSTPTGASVVMVNILAFLVFTGIRFVKGRVKT